MKIVKIKIIYLLIFRIYAIKNFTFEFSIFLKFYLQMLITGIIVYLPLSQNQNLMKLI